MPASSPSLFAAQYLPHWQSLPNMSLFALGEVGGPGKTMALAGVRFHLGDDDSLRDRHHQQNVYFPIDPFRPNAKPHVPVLSPPPAPPPPPPPPPPTPPIPD